MVGCRDKCQRPSAILSARDMLVALKGAVVIGLTDGKRGVASITQFERFARAAVPKPG